MKNQRLSPEERDAKILKLLRQGLGAGAIAERIGLSKTTVNDRIVILRRMHSDVPSPEAMKLRVNFR